MRFAFFSWYFNPVFRREMLTRWRHPAAFVLVIAYALVIAVVMGFQVYEAPNGQNEAQLGHGIWQTLTVTQAIAWILLGPVLTSGALAGEREKGHLDALRLSPLTAHEIVLGKLLGALSLAFLLLLVPLPPLALCFLLGGVSPTEFLFSFVLNFFTALTGMSLGLVVSGQSRDSGHAVLRALMHGFMLQLIIFVAQVVLCCLPIISPVWLLFNLLQREADFPWWQIAGFALVQLWITRRQLRFAEQLVIRPPLELEPDFAFLTYAPAQPTVQPRGVVTNHKASPLLDLLRFRNPVLQREVRALIQFRWSRDRNTNDVVVSLSFIAFMIWAMPLTLVAWFEPKRCVELWWLVSYPWLFFAMGVAALTAAVSLTREREGGHWPLLWLTPLTRSEILGGKINGVLIGIAFWSLCLVPFWLPCIFNVPISVLVGTFLIVASATWLATTIGLFFSAICQKSSSALNWTIMVLLIWCIGHAPSQNWQTQSFHEAFLHAVLLFGLGELLYGLTHRILRRAPYER